MSAHARRSPTDDRALLPLLLALTMSTGIVDAVSYLGLGQVFTANMTGNIIFLGFALAGAPGLSIPRSSTALVGFLVGALLGGSLARRTGLEPQHRWVAIAYGAEASLLLAAVGTLGFSAVLPDASERLYVVIALTALAMGLRNAAVRSLGVPDMTTTVLTLTITGLAADSTLTGGDNPRWPRRIASVVAMSLGAAAGVVLLGHSLALPLAVCSAIAVACACVTYLQGRRKTATRS